MKIILPFRQPEKYPLTQKFGEKFMYQGELATHKGVDYAMPKYTQIIAPFDGIVKRTTPGRNTSYGQAVYLEANDQSQGKIQALMAHLEVISVEVGYKMKMGQNIGQSGRTGFWRGKNGYHLHFGLSRNGSYFDPLPFLKIADPNQTNMFDDESRIKSALGAHTVVAGESLWKIAEKYYGNGGHYNEIFLANQDVLKHPNIIQPGQILRIPALKNKGI